jgi:hypothetical protein
MRVVPTLHKKQMAVRPHAMPAPEQRSAASSTAISLYQTADPMVSMLPVFRNGTIPMYLR